MNQMHLFFLLSFTLTFFAAVSAQDAGTTGTQALPSPSKTSKPLFTRHGMVYSAEISRIKPEFGNEVRADQPRFTETVDNRTVPVDPVWAEIVMRPHPGRSVSRFDYVLVTPSGEHPCLAVAKNDDAYSQLKECWSIPPGKLRPQDFVRYLYALPPAAVPDNQTVVTIPWKLNISSTNLPVPELKFRVLPKELPFSKVSQQPASGSLGLTWEELHPAPLTTEAASAEAAAPDAAAEEKKPDETSSTEPPAQGPAAAKQ